MLIIDSQSANAAETVSNATRGFDAGKKTNGSKRHSALDSGSWSSPRKGAPSVRS
jgi:hypothetical protein